MPLPPRPHPLARSPLVGKANRWLESAWKRGWLDHPPLDPDTLYAKAMDGFKVRDEHCGRSQADVLDFGIRLARLTAAIESEAALNPLGKAIAHGQLVRVIRQRLGLGALWRKSPQLLEITLAPPIVVVGQMRAGTTRIHRLLAADPAHCATRFCDSWHPVPERLDLRPLWSGMALFMARRLNPWIDTIHPFGAARADEELGWLACALDHCTYEAQWHIPSFTAFSEACDPAPVYREYARILRTNAAHCGNADRPRVMKVPQFAEDLPALLAQFPDARIIVARRDDEEVVRSAVSLVANQMTIQSDTVDLDWIEREWRRKIVLRHNRVEQALENFTGPLAEVDFDSLGADWEAEIERIYRALDIPLSDAARTAMRAEHTASRGGAHGQHRGQLAEFKEGEARAA